MPAESVSWNITRRRRVYSERGIYEGWVRVLRIPNPGVLRQKEPLEQSVHSQQSVAGQRDALFAALSDVAVRGNRIERIAEPLQDVDLILVAEVGRPDGPQLQLQDELADH